MAKKTKNTPPKVHVTSALALLAHNSDMTHTELATVCGITKQAMSRRFDQRKNISVGAAAEMAEAMGYEMALVPKGSDYPPESIRISPELSEKHDLGGRR